MNEPNPNLTASCVPSVTGFFARTGRVLGEVLTNVHTKAWPPVFIYENKNELRPCSPTAPDRGA